MTLHQVEYFLVLAKFLNFSKAADEAYISQSTLSNQIKKLEKELGVSLFVRDATTNRLSPAGEDFLLHARRISAEVAKSRDKMEEYTNYQRGHIRIGFAPSLETSRILSIANDFIKSYNHMEAHYYSDSTDNLLAGMREKKSMVAFVTSPFAPGFNVNFYPLFQERIALLISKKNPLSSLKKIDILKITDERFLITSTTRYHLDHLFSNFGVNLKIVIFSDDAQLLKNMAEEDLGIAMLGERTARKLAAVSRCAAVDIEHDLFHRHGMVVPILKKLPMSTVAFRDLVLSRLEQIGPTESHTGAGLS